MYYTIAEPGVILTSEREKRDESDPNITDNHDQRRRSL